MADKPKSGKPRKVADKKKAAMAAPPPAGPTAAGATAPADVPQTPTATARVQVAMQTGLFAANVENAKLQFEVDPSTLTEEQLAMLKTFLESTNLEYRLVSILKGYIDPP